MTNFDCSWIGGLHEHEGHGRSEQNDVAVFVVGEIFAFKIPGVVLSDVVHLDIAAATRWPYSSQNAMT